MISFKISCNAKPKIALAIPRPAKAEDTFTPLICNITKINTIKNTYLRRKTSENDFLKEQGIKPG